jgi:hypothetical protein
VAITERRVMTETVAATAEGPTARRVMAEVTPRAEAAAIPAEAGIPGRKSKTS